MTPPRFAQLGEVLLEAKPGFACGEVDEQGIIQVRMNNVTRDGQLDLTSQRRVPRLRRGLDDFLLKDGDVLLNATNSPELVGKAAIFSGADEPVVYSNHFLRLRTDQEQLLAAYLARWLQMKFEQGRFKSICRQWVNQATLNRDALLNMRIPLPTLDRQQGAIEILDRADALRAKGRHTLGHLDDLTQSVFLDTFGDLETSAQGWPKHELSELVPSDDRINYGVVQPGHHEEAGVPIVRVGDLIGGRIRHARLKRITRSIESAYTRSRLRGNEILVSCVGSIGIVATAEAADVGLNIARAIVRIPIDDSISRLYIASYLKTRTVQNYFTRELRTVSQPTLNVKQIRETLIPVPSMALQSEFIRRIEAAERIKTPAQERAAEFDELFASLRDRAFAGRL